MSLVTGLKSKFYNKRSIIIVESPIQLLCAYEAIKLFELNYVLYIRTTDNELDNSQMRYIVDTLSIKYVKYIKISAKKNLFNLFKISMYYINFKLSNYDIYFLGDYLSRFLKMSKIFINNNQVVLLDDGVATFQIQRELKNKNVPITLFTMFDIKPFVNQKVFKNNFRELKTKYPVDKISQVDVFIGGKLVDLGIMSVNAYIDVLNVALKNSSGNQLLYFPHRGTSSEVLNRISSLEGLQIIYPESTVELYLLKEKIKPKNIYSILSTALFSLSIIFEESTLIAYKPNFLKNEREKDIKKLYESISRFDKINLLEL